MKKLVIVSIFLHFFVGVGAMFGGFAAIISPEGPMGISVDALKIGPFENFLIPGIILFVAIGMCNILSGILVMIRIKNYEYIIGFMGATLIGWLGVQCIIMLAIHYLHIIFFIIGSVQGLIALGLLNEKNMFPWSILSKYKNTY